jgi:hypothetical protein
MKIFHFRLKLLNSHKRLQLRYRISEQGRREKITEAKIDHVTHLMEHLSEERN